MDFLLLSLILIFGIGIGWRVREIHAMHYMRKLMAENSSEEESEFEDAENLNVVEINIEQYEDRFFAYRREDSFYMGNGTTMEELADALIKNHPKIDKFKVYHTS